MLSTIICAFWVVLTSVMLKYLAVLDLRNNPGGVFEEAVAMAVRTFFSMKFTCFYTLF